MIGIVAGFAQLFGKEVSYDNMSRSLPIDLFGGLPPIKFDGLPSFCFGGLPPVKFDGLPSVCNNSIYSTGLPAVCANVDGLNPSLLNGLNPFFNWVDGLNPSFN